MSVDKAKLIKTENNILVNNSTNQSTVSSQTTKIGVIPVGQQSDVQSNPIVDYINTPEFKKLSPEQQLKQLKLKFPDVESSILLSTINAVITTAEVKESAEIEQTDAELLAALNEKLNSGETLSEAELKQKEILENRVKYNEAKEKAKDISEEQTADYIIANKVSGKDANEKLDNYIEQYILKGKNLDELSEEDKFAQIAMAKDIKLAMAIAEKLGIDLGEITDISKPEEMTILEQFAQMLQKSGKKDVTIDDVVSFLKSIPEDKRSVDQQKALQYIEAFSAQDVKQLSKEQIIKLLKENSQEMENLISEEVKNSPEWKQKSPTEKMAARADVILEKILPGYSKLPEGDFKDGKITPGSKADIRHNFYEKIGAAIIPDWDKKNEDQKNFEIEMIAIAIDAAEVSNVPLSELLDPEKGPIKMREISAKYGMDTLLAKFTSDNKVDVISKEWVSKKGSEKVNEIADTILESIDKNYKNLSPEQRNKKREKWIDFIAQQLYPDWNELTKSEKDSRKEIFAEELSVIKYLGISPSDYFTMSVETRLMQLSRYEKKCGLDQNMTVAQTIQKDTMLRLAKEGRIKEGTAISVTDQDMLNTLLIKQKRGEKLSNEEINLKKHLEYKIKWYKTAANKHIPPEESIDFQIRKMEGNSIDEKINNYITQILKGRNISEVSQEELKAIFEKIVDPKLAHRMCEKLNINPKQYISTDQAIDQAVEGIIQGRIDDVNAANEIFHARGNANLVNCTTDAIYHSDMNNDMDALNSYNIHTINLSSNYINAITININNTDLISTENAIELGKRYSLSNQTSDANKALFTRSLVTNASSDDVRLMYGEELSKTGVASVLEGLAAASNSIQDESLRNQYNSHVESAASNLPPEQKEAVQTAMKTGEISKETLSKTSSNSETSSSQKTQQPQQPKQAAQKQTPSQTNTPKGSQSSNKTSTQQVVAQQQAAIKQGTQQAVQQAASNQTISSQSSSSTVVSGSASSNVSVNPSPSNYSSTSTASYSAYSSVNSSDEVDGTNDVTGYTRAEAQAITQSDEAKRQELMEKVQELKDEIDQSITEWEARHRKLTTEEGDVITAGVVIDAVVDAVNSSAYSKNDKEELIQRVYSASSIDEIYEILVSKSVSITNVKEKILDLLGSSGSGTNVRNVVTEVIGDDNVVKELFIRSSSTSVKKELLNMMSTDTVVELLASKQIPNIADVDHKILRTFLEKNIYSMSNTEFNEYLKHLPLDDRMALVEMRNNARGITPNITVPQGENHSADMPSLTSQDEQPVSQGNSPLAPNEMSKTLADGSIVTRQGSGFGAISDTDFDTYQVIQPDKKQEGAPIGMNDEVLTVGSAEWNKKYNNNNVQTTAFTMASFDDEDDDFGMNFGSVKGNFKGRKIKKKGRINGFDALG